MKLKSAAMFALVAILLCAPGAAQEWRARIQDALSAKASYDFNDAALGDILRIIAQDAKINIILDDSPQAGIDPLRKLTLQFKEMSRRAVLTWVARFAGLEWVIQDEAVFVTTALRLDQAAKQQLENRETEKRSAAPKTWLPRVEEALARSVTVNFARKPLNECLDSLEILLGINILLAPDVKRDVPISLSVSKMTAESLLTWVAKKANIDFAVMDEAVYYAGISAIRTIRVASRDFSAQGRGFNIVTFEFRDTPLDEAYDYLSRQSGVRIVLRREAGPLPLVTLSGKDMPLGAAVQAVTNASGLNNAIIPEGDVITVQLLARAPAPPAVTKAPAAEPAPDGGAQLAPGDQDKESGAAASEEALPDEAGATEEPAEQP